MRPAAMPKDDAFGFARLRTALWIRTRASAATVQHLLSPIPAGIVAVTEGGFVHVLYDEARWQAADAQTRVVTQIRATLTAAGVLFEPAIGTHVLPPQGPGATPVA